MDLFAPCYEWKDWKVAQEFGYYPYFTPIQSEAGPEVEIGGECKIMLGSNNYMG
jgi:8-amino-7-oxononanoate synthase